MARKGPRTAPCGAADARVRIRKAEAFLAQARRALADPASPDAAAALAVLAGIAASDASCCAQLGIRSRGQDHRQAREILAKVQPHGMQMARLLDELLSAKDATHYGTILIEHGRALRLVQQAERLVLSARKTMVKDKH
jgi:hypothetical protein